MWWWLLIIMVIVCLLRGACAVYGDCKKVLQYLSPPPPQEPAPPPRPPIQVERNILENAMIKPISVGYATTKDMTVKHNLFQGHCSPEDSFLQLNGAEMPEFIDNLWCPQ